MHLIADSGSTKTDWRIAQQPSFQLATNGLNPMVASHDFLNREIKYVSHSKLIKSPITQVTFYGAGCSKNESIHLMKTVLREHFPLATIEVGSDLVGAAKALFNKSEGIVAILGTGSNAAYYDGENLHTIIPSLGYLLGDDGAGTGIGRALLKEYLYGNQNWKVFLNQQDLETNPQIIIKKIYESERPNTYISSFAKAALKNLNEPFIRVLVKRQFNQFINDMVLPQTINTKKIGFVGSIAYHGKLLLTEVCDENGLEIIKIIQQPIEELAKHLENKE